MQPFRKILVGINLGGAEGPSAAELGAPTREAVKRAVWLAEQLGSALTFFAAEDVAALQSELGDAIDRDHIAKSGNAILDELVAQAKENDIVAEAKLDFGTPWQAIIKEAIGGEYDLVIVGTRDRGAASRILFGSTAMKLLRNCPCPVWVTRPDPDWDDLNILVASDFSDVSQRALNLAVDGAQLADAKLHLAHAIDNTHVRRMWLTGMRDDEVHSVREKRLAEVESQLHEQLGQTDYRTLSYGVQTHVVEGAADIAMLNLIEEHDIDLLVMGTAARSGIAGFVIGNTAERLLAQVPCSVLAVKPDGFECPVDVA